MNKRFWEIDALRGFAIIAMIFFHLVFDLQYFKIIIINIDSYFWIIFRVCVFSLFFLLVGISLTLSYSKSQHFKKFLLRGLKIFSWGLIITLATFLFLKEGIIYFGVLHFIGISIILSYPFLKRKTLNLIFALPILITGIILAGYSFGFPWLLWLGLKPHQFYTLDYFPLLPYFAVILTGIWLGATLYQNHKRQFALKDLSANKPSKILQFLGKNSFFIYLIHQPIIVGLLFLHLFIKNLF